MPAQRANLWFNAIAVAPSLVAAGLAVALWHSSPVILQTSVPPWIFWGFLPLIVLAELYPVTIRVGRAVHVCSIAELPLACAMLLGTPHWVIAGYAITVATALVIERDSAWYFLPNVAWAAASVSVGLVVQRFVGGVTDTPGLRTWAGVAVGGVVVGLVGFIPVPLLSKLRGSPPFEGLQQSVFVSQAVTLASATVAMITIRLLMIDAELGILVGMLAAGGAVGYRSYTRLLSQNESLERLYESTREVDRPRDDVGSIETLLDQTLELLGAHLAEITLLPTDDHPALVLMTGRDGTFREVSDVTAELMAAERVTELRGEVPDVEEFDSEVAVQLSKQIITAPLQGTGGVIGTLRVSMNFGDAFTDADRRLFEMFANHASVALRNSTLIDQLRAEVAEREHQALHDSLTALPNRVMFDLQVRQALDRATDGEVVAVLLADLDRFKEVNDTLGHDHGDELLEVLAERLGGLAVDGRFTVARLGGDEFAMLLRGEGGDEDVLVVAQQVKAVLESPCEIAGVLVDIGASIGVAVAPRDGYDATTLLQRADVAMYIAKEDRRGISFYEQESDPYSPQRLSLAADLRRAVADGQVEPWFQPVLSLSTGEPISVEALARWTHPELGNIPPDVFIPIAEQSGLIRDLTYVILDRSLEQVRRWRNAGHHLKVAVNLSVRCLTDPNLVDQVERHLHLAGVEPGFLTLEVTEGTIMSDPKRAIEVLEELHSIGVRLSIDDFGMGYSSLNQLKRMPVDQLKIDRSFVMHLPHDRQDAVIVESVIDLGHALGMQVVAEGVEEPETLQALKEMRCDSVQGYYVSKPLPPADLLTWLRRRPTISRVPVPAAN